MTIDSRNMRRVSQTLIQPGLFCTTESRGQPVKTRIMLLAVVLGSVVFALIAAHAGPWPPI
jgi:hypothetical protein